MIYALFLLPVLFIILLFRYPLLFIGIMLAISIYSILEYLYNRWWRS